ncbi:MAG: N-acetyltransferase [Rhizobacter sp.]|nr:N-acetyltransferase [Rhizobacter sp.]
MIHPSAIVSPKARLGTQIEVGPFTIIHDDVQIGDGAVIGSHCEIGLPSALAEGAPLVIGDSALIRSHSIFYQGSTFGNRLVTGHRVTVREKTVAGENLQIGTLSDLQGHCTIGNYVRFHSNVHIGQKSSIGNFVWIFPYVVLTNDPHPPSTVLRGPRIEDFAAIATMSMILPGVTVGEGALVGAHSSVNRDVAPNTVVAGAPAKFVCNANEIKLKDGTGRPAYPWRDHFHRGYPEAVVAQWLKEAEARHVSA